MEANKPISVFQTEPPGAYQYYARCVLLCHSSVDAQQIRQFLDIILQDEHQKYTLNGICAQFGPMQLLLVEGRGDAISRLALTLQPFCSRWQGLDQENPLRYESVKR